MWSWTHSRGYWLPSIPRAFFQRWHVPIGIWKNRLHGHVAHEKLSQIGFWSKSIPEYNYRRNLQALKLEYGILGILGISHNNRPKLYETSPTRSRNIEHTTTLVSAPSGWLLFRVFRLFRLFRNTFRGEPLGSTGIRNTFFPFPSCIPWCMLVMAVLLPCWYSTGNMSALKLVTEYRLSWYPLGI